MLWAAMASDARHSTSHEREIRLLGTGVIVANEASDAREALAAAVELVCDHTGWPVGHAWLREQGEDDLRPLDIWRRPSNDPRLDEFVATTRGLTFGPGVGLPGRVIESGGPVWLTDLANQPNFPRRHAAQRAGLSSGFAFPVSAGGDAVAVLEFFSRDPTPVDDELLRVMAEVGAQLGLAIARIRASAALAAANEDLQRANAQLDAFAAVASHDLREPLRTVGGFAQLLGRRYGEVLDDQGQEYLAFIVDGVQRMNTLIEDVLQFSRAGRGERRRDRVDLAALAAEVIDAHAAALQRTGADVLVEDLPVVEGDAGPLRQVLANLLGNAVKFTGDAPPDVRITADRGDGEWVVSVADRGIGIPSDQAERVFTMFARLHARSDYEGSGIGLAICERIVARHGGRIWHEPGPDGVGSVMRFSVAD